MNTENLTPTTQDAAVSIDTREVPTIELDTLDKAGIATQKELRGHAKQVENLAKIPFKDIRVRKGFNKRGEFKDIEELAESIKCIGLQKPIQVDALKSGEFILTDGERRYRAISLLVERGEKGWTLEDTYVEAKINPRDTTEEERLIIMAVSNSGKPFEPLEEAEIFKALNEVHGLEPIQIARTTGNSIAYVEQRLIIANASEEEKQLIRDGKVKATVVMELSRKEKDATKRVAKIKEANEAGTRLKVKDVKGSDVKDLWSELDVLIRELKNDNEDEIVADSIELIELKLKEIRKALK